MFSHRELSHNNRTLTPRPKSSSGIYRPKIKILTVSENSGPICHNATAATAQIYKTTNQNTAWDDAKYTGQRQGSVFQPSGSMKDASWGRVCLASALQFTRHPSAWKCATLQSDTHFNRSISHNVTCNKTYWRSHCSQFSFRYCHESSAGFTPAEILTFIPHVLLPRPNRLLHYPQRSSVKDRAHASTG